MKLAICYQHVHPQRGGAETYIADLCRALARRGHEVELLAETHDPKAIDPRVAVRAITRSGRTSLGRIWNFALACEQVLAASTAAHDASIGFINTWGQDILIPQGGVRPASLEANARRFAHPAGRALYTLAKQANPKWWVYRAIEARQYDPARNTRIIAVSAMVRDHLMRFHRVPSDRIRVIHNAIDSERIHVASQMSARSRLRTSAGVPASATVALFTGHNFRLKGLSPLLQALASSRHRGGPPVHVLICGSGDASSFETEAKLMGVADRVHFAGFVADVRDAYAASDFFVLPTYYDPCSLVVFEALATGLPVITTRCNGAGELITPNRQGTVVDHPDAIDQLAAALNHWADPTARAAGAKHALQLAARHTFDAHVDRLLEVAEDVAREKKARPNRPTITTHTPATDPRGRAQRYISSATTQEA